MYQTKKQTYIDNSKKWNKENPEKNKEQCLKANRKFRTENKERFNELMRKNYHKNKPKWISRQWAYQIINDLKKKTDIKKECKKCKKKDNLSLKFEVYPTNAKDIRQAIKDQKIYYLCKGCRYG